MTETTAAPASVLLHQYRDKETLALQLAQQLARQLQRAQREREKAVVAFSGGTTPVPMLAALSKQQVDWSRVIVTLVDERWVDADNPRSNAALIRRYLLDRLPTEVEFRPLYRADMNADQAVQRLSAEFQTMLPLDVTILGMGSDGHTASFFPDADNIETLLDPEAKDILAHCHSPASREPRICWSLSSLLASRWLALHLSGTEKFRVLQQAWTAQDRSALPVRAIVHQQLVPLQVFFTPEQDD